MTTASPRTNRRKVVAIGGLAVLLALVGLWTWSPLGESVDARALIATARRIAAEPLAPIVLLVGYVVAGLLVVPMIVVMGATVVAFGAWPGALYAMIGANLAAAVVFAIARFTGSASVDRWLARHGGSTIVAIEAQVARRGILSIAVVRLLPLPFALVNAIAGVSTIAFRDFILGTVIGLVPILTLFATVSTRLDAWLERPDFSELVPLAVAVIGALVAAYGLRAWALRRARQPDDVDL